jgi:hypothetical protein
VSSAAILIGIETEVNLLGKLNTVRYVNTASEVEGEIQLIPAGGDSHPPSEAI